MSGRPIKRTLRGDAESPSDLLEDIAGVVDATDVPPELSST